MKTYWINGRRAQGRDVASLARAVWPHVTTVVAEGGNVWTAYTTVYGRSVSLGTIREV